MIPCMWSSYLLEWEPQQMVRLFAAHGWRALELSDEHAHDLLKLGKPLSVGVEFRRIAADLGISFPQGHFLLSNRGCRPEDQEGRQPADIAPAGETEFRQVMDDMRRWVDLFNALGIKAGVLHLGGWAQRAAGVAPARILGRQLEAVARIADYAKGGPTTICLENLLPDGGGMTTIIEFRTVLDALRRDNVGICLDTGHANIAKLDMPEFIRFAGPRLRALHIADNLGYDDHHMLPYGRGTVSWPAVLRALHDIEYVGPLNFEVPGENRCPEPVRLAKLDYALKLANWMIGQA